MIILLARGGHRLRLSGSGEGMCGHCVVYVWPCVAMYVGGYLTDLW